MKNIIFDLGGVILVDKTYTVLDNLDIDKNTYNELKKFFLDCDNLDLGKMTVEEKYNSCNFPKEYDKYKEYVINYYKHRIFNMELIDIINKLKKNNYNVYILSDNNREVYEYDKNHELFKNIDGWVLSCEYGTVKREGKLFDIFLNKFNLKASECYFIDDNMINIKEAEKHGITCYQYSNDTNFLISDMRINGINI